MFDDKNYYDNEPTIHDKMEEVRNDALDKMDEVFDTRHRLRDICIDMFKIALREDYDCAQDFIHYFNFSDDEVICIRESVEAYRQFLEDEEIGKICD